MKMKKTIVYSFHTYIHVTILAPISPAAFSGPSGRINTPSPQPALARLHATQDIALRSLLRILRAQWQHYARESAVAGRTPPNGLTSPDLLDSSVMTCRPTGVGGCRILALASGIVCVSSFCTCQTAAAGITRPKNLSQSWISSGYTYLYVNVVRVSNLDFVTTHLGLRSWNRARAANTPATFYSSLTYMYGQMTLSRSQMSGKGSERHARMLEAKPEERVCGVVYRGEGSAVSDLLHPLKRHRKHISATTVVVHLVIYS